MATANKIINVSDRVERAKALLLYQFKDKPNINALVDVVVSELQELENAITDLQTARTLQGSYGVFLDEIGKRLKVERGNYADPDYKTAIKIAMAKKTASATAQDILFIVELLTADPDAILTNNYPYMVELTGYLFCIADDPAGLEALADLFPLNTRVRIIQQFGKSFKFGTSGRGFGSGSTLNNLAYYRYGVIDDPVFNVSPQEVTPPALNYPPFNIVEPYITGDGVQGQELSVSNGEWGGTTPISITYQWLREGADIGGETSSSYTLTSLDLGLEVSCKVTATNSFGNSSIVTNSVQVSDTPPVSSLLVDGIGLNSVYATSSVIGGPNQAISSVTISSDGTTTMSGNATSSLQYLSTTGAGLGADFTLTYSVIDGEPFTNLNPNTPYNLATTITFTKATPVVSFGTVETGTYLFTIRSVSDTAVVKSKQITITAETLE